MVALTKSPIATRPTSKSFSKTGKCRKCLSVINFKHSSTVLFKRTLMTAEVMSSETCVLSADKSRMIIFLAQSRSDKILSERDCARKIIMRDLSADSTQVSELMTSAVISVRLNNTVEECLKLMTDRHLRHLPVLENDLLVGLVAIGDLVKATIEDQHDLIQQLQHYISH